MMNIKGTYCLSICIIAPLLLCISSQSLHKERFLRRRSIPIEKQDELSTHDEEELQTTADHPSAITKLDESFYDEEYYLDYDEVFKDFELNHVDPNEKNLSKLPKKFRPEDEKDSRKGQYPKGTEEDPLALPEPIDDHTTENPLNVYGMPRELRPIASGGGSRFDDIERKKINQAKMAQLKEGPQSDEGHETEGSPNGASITTSWLFNLILSSVSLTIIYLIENVT